MTQEYLIQCQSRDNVFQCNLNTDFRDIKCGSSKLSLKYIESTLSSPQLDDMIVFLRPTNFLNLISLKMTLTNPCKVFSELTKLYKKSINGASECLFYDVFLENDETEPIDLYQAKLTLLPNQILIAPEVFINNLRLNNTDRNRIKFYSQDELM